MKTGSRRSRYVVVATVVAVVAALFQVGVAAAAPPAPNGLSPSGGPVVGANTELTWNPSPGALTYDVQISANASMSPLLSGGNVNNTPNTTYSPPDELPVGTIYWQVRATDSNGDSTWSQANFEKALEGPDLVSPPDGTTLQFPTEPPTFAWDTLPTAKSYVVEIDDADDFIGAEKIVTSNPTTTLTDTQELGQTFFWRVRGSSNTSGSGILTEWSEVWEYDMAWTNPSPMLVSPPDTSPLTEVTDVELVWNPVLGAQNYQLQVNLSEDFTGDVIEDRTVYGTRYSPETTYLNGAYHWRVRPRDDGNHLGEWSEVFSFTRNWTSAPTLAAPTNGEIMLDPFEFSWNPVDHASEYEIQVGDDPNFSNGTFDDCSTLQTKVTPYDMEQGSTFGGCGIFDGVGHGTTYHWRVRGIDEPKGVLGLWSPVRSFIRRMPIPTRVSPANGATVAVPVLDWDEVDGASRYHVWITKDGSSWDNEKTYATEYTPSKELDPGTYKWYVTTISPDGPGIIPNVATHSSFTVSPDPGVSSPEPISPADNASSVHMPVMTWTPVTDATEYEVWYSVVGSGVEFELGDSKNPGYAHSGEPLPNGAYLWYVKAYDGNTLLNIGTPRQLDIVDIPLVTQTGPDDCPPAAACQKLTSSPTYMWDYQTDARTYLVSMAFDTNFTNILKTYDLAQNYFIPREEYPDNDAGQAYYWHVRPCKSPNRCGPDPQGVSPPQRAFQKRSDKVQLISPADDAVVADQPRLSWEDYLASNGSDIEAERYRVQVSTVPTFSSTLYNERVDQTFVTPFDRTFPEGPLYWRVRAIDGSGNELSWSTEQDVPLEYRSMTKTSPPPCPDPDADPPEPDDCIPAVNDNINGQPTFSWPPQAFAESYRLEVAENADLNFSPANEVLDEATSHAAYTAEDPFPPGTYAWRIRRDDGQGKDGPWSAGRLFTVQEDAPTLLTPADNALVPNDQFVFTWTPLPRAVSYRFERSATDQFTSIAETRNTVMTSWAPIVSYPQQKWFWRVKALDAKGNIIGTSNVFEFNRGADPIASIPQNLSVQESPGRLRVFWQPPAYQGVPQFTDYVVTLQPGNIELELNRNITNTTFNGLINESEYDVTVLARSSGGDGPAALISGTPNGCSETTFSDIPANHLFCSEIRWMFTTGLSTGSIAADGTVRYLPSQAVARQAMAAFLYRYAGSPAVTNLPPHFADVPTNHPFFDEIQWMWQSGNSTGFPNPAGGKPLYKPLNAVDRGGMAAFMYRAAGQPTVTPAAPYFADVGVGHIFYGPIQWMFQAGVSFGTPNPPGKPWYNPVTALAREAMAAFLFRYDQVVP